MQEKSLALLAQVQEIIKIEWYTELINDLKKLEFTGIVLTKWNIGKRIDLDIEKFGKPEYGSKRIENLAKDLNGSADDLWACHRFFKKYKEIEKLDAVQQFSWRYIWHKLLPEGHREKTPLLPLPEGKYNVIYSDCPWTYRNTGVEGAVDQEYPTLTIQELCDLPIKDLVTENAVLFLWVTNPILEECFPVIKSWGFSYKTNIVYIKRGGSPGIGFYVRGCHELLLICIKGSFLPLTKEYVSSVIETERLPHSQKPEIVYEIIEKLYPNQKYLELFARNNKTRKGWKYWGNEAVN